MLDARYAIVKERRKKGRKEQLKEGRKIKKGRKGRKKESTDASLLLWRDKNHTKI
jgi:hypothetical protein